MVAVCPFRSPLAVDSDDVDLGWTCAECGCSRCRGELEGEPAASDRSCRARNAGLPPLRRNRYPLPPA